MAATTPQSDAPKGPWRAYAAALAIVAVLSAVVWLRDYSMDREPQDDERALPPPFAALLPLHKKLPKPDRGDWLDKHPELSQTYDQYLRCCPVLATPERSTLYVQPLGPFSPSDKKIVDQTAQFLSIYFQLPVKMREALPLDLIPPTARRTRGADRHDQINSTFVLNQVLKPRLPPDAMGLIAFTTRDLWPGEGWNRVYGHADYADRVAVWSIHCFGNPAESDDAFRRCLLRAFKAAAHETGHMFSIPHCTFFECNLCGSNHLAEADRHPLELCPVCLAKTCRATSLDPAQRFRKLIAFYASQGLQAEQEFCERSLAAIAFCQSEN